jgi:hypothetical protein
MALVRPDFILLNGASPYQKAPGPGRFPPSGSAARLPVWTTASRPFRSTGTKSIWSSLRQNKVYGYEAPFMYLYFGNERMLI